MEGYCFPEVESKLNLNELNWSNNSMLAEGKFKLYFFSLESKQWEPIVQNFSFYLGSNKDKETTVNFFNTNIYDNKDINVTITEDFVISITFIDSSWNS